MHFTQEKGSGVFFFLTTNSLAPQSSLFGPLAPEAPPG
jgi:hypothetical protein